MNFLANPIFVALGRVSGPESLRASLTIFQCSGHTWYRLYGQRAQSRMEPHVGRELCKHSQTQAPVLPLTEPRGGGGWVTSHVRLICNAMGCSPPGSSAHGIFQARRLEWAAISFSRGTSQPRDQIWIHAFIIFIDTKLGSKCSWLLPALACLYFFTFLPSLTILIYNPLFFNRYSINHMFMSYFHFSELPVYIFAHFFKTWLYF